jgi:MFS family permease
MPPLRTRLGALLAVPRDRDARIFAATGVVDALGNSMFIPVSALFFVNVTGLPVTRVGVGLSIAGVVGMLGPLASGPPVDRFGPRRVVLVLYALRAVGYSCYPLVRGFWPFVALVSATAVVDHMSRPALQALAAGLADEADRVTTLAFVRSVRNLGWALGGLLVAGALAIGGKGAYVGLVLGDAATFVVAGLLLLRVREVRAAPHEGPRTGYGAVLRNRRFVALGALHGILTLNVAMLILGFPLWIDRRTNAPTAVAGLVFTLNSLLVVVLQVPFSRRLTSVALGGRALRNSGYATAAACVLLALTPGLPVWPAVALLVVAACVQCAGELWEAAGGWAVSLDIAPEHARGRYLGLWDMGFVFYDVGGPILMAFIVEDAGRAGWLGFGAFMAVMGLVASRLAAGADPGQPLPERLDPVDSGVDDRSP